MVNVQRVLDWRLSKLGDYQTAERDFELKQQRSSAKPTDTKLQSLVETVSFFSRILHVHLYIIQRKNINCVQICFLFPRLNIKLMKQRKSLNVHQNK